MCVAIVYGIYYNFFEGNTIKANNIGAMDLINVDKIKVKLTKSKTLKYFYALEQFADNAHDKGLSMVE